MIGTEDLEELLSLTLASAYVKGEKPVSLMIVSDRPESGKTELVNKFIENKHLVYLSDITAYALWRDFHKQIEAGEVAHLVIPEFLAPISRGQQTVASFIATLQMLIEEGIMEIHTGFLQPIKLASPTTVGAIICMPRSAFYDNRIDWETSGFLSRFMVASYCYDDTTIEKIFDSIMNREYMTETHIKLSFPEKPIQVAIPIEVATRARTLAVNMSAKARKTGKAYGFRDLKNILRMIASSVVLDNGNEALQEWRFEANDDDYTRVERLSYLLNEDFNNLAVETNAEGIMIEPEPELEPFQTPSFLNDIKRIIRGNQ